MVREDLENTAGIGEGQKSLVNLQALGDLSSEYPAHRKGDGLTAWGREWLKTIVL